MRLADLSDYLRLRRFTSNPWHVCRFRTAQRNGEVLTVLMRDQPPIFLRGGMSDFHMFHRIFLRDEYRLNAIPPGSLRCVIDLGANVGLFSARVAQLARRVYAYEPFPDNRSSLQQNLGSRKNIVVRYEAVAGEPGVLRIYQPRDLSCTGSYSSFTDMAVTAEQFSDVPAVTLAQVFKQHAIDHCDLVKIDIEGQEYQVIHAAGDDLLSRIQRIHGEYHNVAPEDPRTRIDHFAGFLRSKGFRVDVLPHRRKPNHGMFFAELAG